MFKFQALLTAFSTVLLGSSALFAQTVINTDAQKELSIAIYNENRALIKDTRSVHLKIGINDISFSGISAGIIPESALLTGRNITTREQNFNYDLLSADSLLRKSVGQTVTVEYINPKTGEKETNSAKLLAYNGGEPVLEINGKIEANYPGRIIFNSIPENLISQPTLSLEISSPNPGVQPLNLSYLTTGLSWRANYVAEINSDETKMNLNGFITLSNNSGVSYHNAKLQLIAGSVHMVEQYMPRMVKTSRYPTAALQTDMAVNSLPRVENLSDFYLYTLPQKTNLLSQQTKQVALLSSTNINIQKQLVFDNSLAPSSREFKNIKPTIFLSFENKKQNQLGIALPKGTIRLYKNQGKSGLLFIGEDDISHTGNLETVKLNLGESFDVSANAKRTEYITLSQNAYEAAYEITFKNGSVKDVPVTLYQNFPNNWKIISQTVLGEKTASNQNKWVLTVPANGEFVFSYKVQVKND